LAARFPHDGLFRIRGYHDWCIWEVLWRDMLNTGLALQRAM
jgi:hypothetical protein